MTFTIAGGLWLVPLAVTVAAYAWAAIESAKYPVRPGGYFPDMSPLIWLWFYGLATLVSLIAWLAWAVIT